MIIALTAIFKLRHICQIVGEVKTWNSLKLKEKSTRQPDSARTRWGSFHFPPAGFEGKGQEKEGTWEREGKVKTSGMGRKGKRKARKGKMNEAGEKEEEKMGPTAPHIGSQCNHCKQNAYSKVLCFMTWNRAKDTDTDSVDQRPDGAWSTSHCLGRTIAKYNWRYLTAGAEVS